ncbi:MFS transporter, NNP family, nitrate/nitrite transporter [Lentibacillus persicus]|uniref:MFS transporter, NNP family, nitrate/nitrite transporter n=1 Tax=Lentibacillus persicus TaxID=640948 RepID=A0A1I1X1W4_9BACI|nr:MFS transporter [Lentibacillus persicus]SFE00608.1 MFS transporter, NNP family, nitrate/nitrite transporter [Lentibacillus persicus]
MEQQKGSTAALVYSTIAMVVSFTIWSMISPMASNISALYNLSATQVSILVAVPTILGSIMRIPLGILSDKYSGRKVYTLTMLFLILPLIGASFANSYGWMLFFAFFIGMGGTTFAIAITYVSGWYPKEKQGLVLGIAGVGNIGTAVAGFLIPVIVAAYSIDWAFRILAVMIAIMAVVFYFGTEDREQGGQKTLKSALEPLKYKQTWMLSLFYFLTFGVFVALGLYLPTLLQDLYDITAVDAGQRAAIFVVIATFIRPLGGMIADKLDPKKILTSIFLVIAVSAAVLAFTTGNVILFTIFCLAIAVFSGMGNGVVFKLVPMVSQGNTGAVTGIVGAAGGLGGFFPPILLGVFKDLTGGYYLGFLLLALFSLACLWINLQRKKLVQ